MAPDPQLQFIRRSPEHAIRRGRRRNGRRRHHQRHRELDRQHGYGPDGNLRRHGSHARRFSPLRAKDTFHCHFPAPYGVVHRWRCSDYGAGRHAHGERGRRDITSVHSYGTRSGIFTFGNREAVNYTGRREAIDRGHAPPTRLQFSGTPADDTASLQVDTSVAGFDRRLVINGQSIFLNSAAQGAVSFNGLAGERCVHHQRDHGWLAHLLRSRRGVAHEFGLRESGLLNSAGNQNVGIHFEGGTNGAANNDACLLNFTASPQSGQVRRQRARPAVTAAW